MSALLNRNIAIINEANCIGCNKCLKVCPVDAVVGSINYLHTILVDICIGCNLCLEACPTECISIKKRLFVSYIVKRVNKNSLHVIVSSIEDRSKLASKSRIRYKKRISRLKDENLKNLTFYKEKNLVLRDIRKEISFILKIMQNKKHIH